MVRTNLPKFIKMEMIENKITEMDTITIIDLVSKIMRSPSSDDERF